jgi:hypothetical protein
MHTPVSTTVSVSFLLIRFSGAYTLFMHHCAIFAICKLCSALSEFQKVSYLMLLSVTDFLYCIIAIAAFGVYCTFLSIKQR